MKNSLFYNHIEENDNNKYNVPTKTNHLIQYSY